MKSISQIISAVLMLLLLQSCMIKSGSNLAFLKQVDFNQEAEVVSVKVPMFLVKPYLRKSLKGDDGKKMRKMMKKIKRVRLSALSDIAQSKEQIDQQFKQYLLDEKMEEYAEILSDGDRVSINALSDGDRISRLLLDVSSGTNDQVFIQIDGNFSVEDLAEAVSSYQQNQQ